jgi:hypothetical protein
MRFSNIFAVVLGGLGLGAAGMVNPAAAADQLTCEDALANPNPAIQSFAEYRFEAECACEAALAENTEEALLDFYRRYPGAPTACRALAQEMFENENQPDEPVILQSYRN